METKPKGDQSSQDNERTYKENVNSLIDLHIEENEIKPNAKRNNDGDLGKHEEDSMLLQISETGKLLLNLFYLCIKSNLLFLM